MPYIARNEKGKIVQVYNSPKSENDQWLEANDPELISFFEQISSAEQAKQTLKSTDAEMVRVVEDLIDLLIEKQVFMFTELPETVQTKLNARKKLRKNITSLTKLIDDDDAIF